MPSKEEDAGGLAPAKEDDAAGRERGPLLAHGVRSPSTRLYKNSIIRLLLQEIHKGFTAPSFNQGNLKQAGPEFSDALHRNEQVR